MSSITKTYTYEISGDNRPPDGIRGARVVKADDAVQASLTNPHEPWHHSRASGPYILLVHVTYKSGEISHGKAEIALDLGRYGTASYSINYPPEGLGSSLL